MSKHFELKYRPDIDGLRAVAVAAVVLHHAFPDLLPGGFVGVDIFFVISGFLITRRLVKDFETRTFSYADFYARRVGRIFPALVAVLFTFMAIGWFVLTAPEYERFGRHVLASALFVQNLNLLKESGYFDLSSTLKPLLHLWSLSIEEQFYIFWPVLIGVLYRCTASPKFGLRVMVFFSFIAGLIWIEKDQASAFYQIQFRLWELGAGGLIATLSQKEKLRLSKLPQNALAILGLGLLLLTLAVVTEASKLPGFWALAPVLGSCLLIVADPSKSSINRHLLSNRAMIWLGLISYPLYLWHWPLLSFARILSNESYLLSVQGVVLRVACVALSVALAAMTFRWIEKPVQRIFKSRPYPAFRRTLVGLIVVFVGIAACGHIVTIKNGVRSRHAATILNPQPPAGVDQLVKLRDCLEDPGLPMSDTCFTNAPVGATPDAVIIGDSHALAMTEAVATHLSKQKRTLMEFEIGDTLGLIGVGNYYRGKIAVGGVRSLDEVFKWAIEHKVKSVILLSRWAVYYEGHGVGVEAKKIEVLEIGNLARVDRRQIILDAFEHTLDRLDQAGVETIFMYDFAELGFYPEDMCLDRPVSLVRERMSPCAVSRKAVVDRQVGYRSAFAQILANHPKVKTVDLTPPLCDEFWCYGARAGELYYWDNNHVNSTGQLRLLPSLTF